jgi:hypothetical protein
MENKDWVETVKDFGKIPENTAVTHTYVYKGDKKIKSARSSCGCTTPVVKGNEVTVTLKGARIPTQAKKTGRFSQIRNQNITVYFKDTSVTDTLTISATISSDV